MPCLSYPADRKPLTHSSLVQTETPNSQAVCGLELTSTEPSEIYITVQRGASLSNRPWLHHTSITRRNLRDNRGTVVSVFPAMPAALVLLLATVLLTSHIPPAGCRPRDRGDDKSRLDEVLLRAGDNAVSSYLLAEKILRNLQRSPRLQEELFVPPFLFEGVMTPLGSGGGGHRARSSLLREERPPEEDGNRLEELEELKELSKRSDDPPLSIDLTFHLLRNMIEMARIESQKEQAELNRKYLDEVGK